MRKLFISYNCKNCDNQFEIEVSCTPYIPAQVSGPPESCYPAEGGEIELTDVSACPSCGTEVDDYSIREEVYSRLADDSNYREPEE